MWDKLYQYFHYSRPFFWHIVLEYSTSKIDSPCDNKEHYNSQRFKHLSPKLSISYRTVPAGTFRTLLQKQDHVMCVLLRWEYCPVSDVPACPGCSGYFPDSVDHMFSVQNPLKYTKKERKGEKQIRETKTRRTIRSLSEINGKCTWAFWLRSFILFCSQVQMCSCIHRVADYKGWNNGLGVELYDKKERNVMSYYSLHAHYTPMHKRALLWFLYIYSKGLK